IVSVVVIIVVGGSGMVVKVLRLRLRTPSKHMDIRSSRTLISLLSSSTKMFFNLGRANDFIVHMCVFDAGAGEDGFDGVVFFSITTTTTTTRSDWFLNVIGVVFVVFFLVDVAADH